VREGFPPPTAFRMIFVLTWSSWNIVAPPNVVSKIAGVLRPDLQPKVRNPRPGVSRYSLRTRPAILSEGTLEYVPDGSETQIRPGLRNPDRGQEGSAIFSSFPVIKIAQAFPTFVVLALFSSCFES